MTPQSIVHWFAPPELARGDLKNRARMLWIVSWPFFIVVAVMLGVASIIDPETLARRATTVAVVGGLMTLLHMTSRSGRPVLASWILVIGLSVIVTQRAWITGGIHAPVAVFYVAFIVMGGTLLGARGAVATAGACTIGAVVLTVGNALSWILPRPGAGPTLSAFVFVMLAIGIALVLHAMLSVRAAPRGLDPDAVHLVVGDMRSPMQVLISRLEVLRRELVGESAKDAEVALQGVWALRRMTNMLLDVSRLQAGRMPLRRSTTDLSGLAHAVAAAVRAAQPMCDIAVETRGDSRCTCDSDLTRRTIENLVINAVKATAIDGRVRVILSGAHDRASISVADEGPTLPADQRALVFEPYLIDRPMQSAADESSGRCLAFCRLAVEAQGGTIRVEDGTPRGNVFVVELPR